VSAQGLEERDVFPRDAGLGQRVEDGWQDDLMRGRAGDVAEDQAHAHARPGQLGQRLRRDRRGERRDGRS